MLLGGISKISLRSSVDSHGVPDTLRFSKLPFQLFTDGLFRLVCVKKKSKMRTYFPVMPILTDLSWVETPKKIYF